MPSSSNHWLLLQISLCAVVIKYKCHRGEGVYVLKSHLAVKVSVNLVTVSFLFVHELDQMIELFSKG